MEKYNDSQKHYVIVRCLKILVSRSGETLVALITFIDDNIIQILLSRGIYSPKLQAGDLHMYSNFGLGRKAVRTGACSEPCSKVTWATSQTQVQYFCQFAPWRWCHSTKLSPVNLEQTYTSLHFKLSCVCTSVATWWGCHTFLYQ